MRLVALLLSALAGLFLFAALDREVERERWLYSSLLKGESGACIYFAQCGLERRELARAEARARVLETLVNRPDVTTPHEPAPTARRRAAAQSTLECSVEDFDASVRRDARTREGLRWLAGLGHEPGGALVALAEAGDPGAQVDLAAGYLQRYRQGQIPHSAGDPVEWLRRAADSGDPGAMVRLALALREPPVDAATLDQARVWNERAVAAAHPEALFVQASVFLKPDGHPAVFQARRLDLLLEAAALCHEPAALIIADRLSYEGRGFAADTELADAILHRVTGDPVFAPAQAADP